MVRENERDGERENEKERKNKRERESDRERERPKLLFGTPKNASLFYNIAHILTMSWC